MPDAPARACYCGLLNCQVHRRTAWRSSTTPPRMRGARLQRARRHLFDRDPLCVLCLALGRYTPATIRDHIVPLAEGGVDDDSNVQALCQACSDTKTQAEAARGVARRFRP
jgi:5-methylcytosine-specific restriction protein A